MLFVSPNIILQDWELNWSYARSSGKGGQNVNKVNSKAILRFNPLASDSLSEDIKDRLRDKFGSRLTSEGELIIQSEKFRDQPRNAADCIAKLKSILLSVEFPPKIRKKTKPTRSAQKKRIESKRKHSEKKQSRKRWSE